MNDHRSGFFTAISRSRITIFVILLFAFGLRLYKSGVHGIYLDEKLTLVCTQGVVLEGSNQRDVYFTPGKVYFTPKEFWKPKTLSDYNEAIIRSDISNSPAYTAMLSGWIEVFGISDFSIRFPSVLFSTFIVGIIYLLVSRYLRSKPLALVCALLAAVEPFFISYSHMARSYCTTIFVSLLATYLFLRILDKRAEGKHPIGFYIGYGLCFALTILGHYLGALVYVCHGLYLLLYVRNWQTYLGLAITWFVSALILVMPWFVFGGGKYIFMTMAYQAQLYRGLAYTNPYDNGFGIILPATVANVVKKMIPITSDLFLLTNGLSNETLAFRNLVLALGFGTLAVGLVHWSERIKATPLWVKVAVPLLLVAAFPLYTVMSARLIVAAAFPLFVYLFYQAASRTTVGSKRHFLVFIGLLSILPTLFILVMAFRNGHTYGITQRYTSFSFPYAIILAGIAVQQVFRQPAYLRLTLGVVLAIQTYFVGDLLHRIYEDQSPKYTYYGRYRIANPYMTAAERIIKSYAPGDTILYPSARTTPRDEIEKTYSTHSIMDAQYTNLYLPKDATYYQRLDTTQTDRIVLVKGKTGSRVVIFDFEGTKYRY
ncbi:hypothetical protein GCM10027341_09450 [Spirosoma knui]